MKTTVINIRNAPPGWQSDPDYVYIGRAGKGLSGDYGNPHFVDRFCSLCQCWHMRGEAIAFFRDETERKFEIDEGFRAKLEKLRGKYLVCFCAPQKCHGDVYVELLEMS